MTSLTDITSGELAKLAASTWVCKGYTRFVGYECICFYDIELYVFLLTDFNSIFF